jgi:hypothetical protein
MEQIELEMNEYRGSASRKEYISGWNSSREKGNSRIARDLVGRLKEQRGER